MANDGEFQIPEDLKNARLDRSEEANLLWDEYKYRHDLIWRHLIRSTLALVALVTIRHAAALEATDTLIRFAFLAAFIYWAITVITIDRELHLYHQVKLWHRYRQNHFLSLHEHDPSAHSKPDFSSLRRGWGRIYLVPGFPRRVGGYLLLLLIGILAMTPSF